MDNNKIKGFILMLFGAFIVLAVGCSSNEVEQQPEVVVDDSDGGDTSNTDTPAEADASEDAVDETVDDEFLSDDEDEEEVEIGELI